MSADLDLIRDLDSAVEDAVRFESAASTVLEAFSAHERRRQSEHPGTAPSVRATPRSLGETIRAFRARAGLTSAAVARAAKLQPSNYSRLEKGAHLPSLATLSRVASALQVPLRTLLAAVPEDLDWAMAVPRRVVVKNADMKRIEKALRSPPRPTEALREAFAAHRRR